MTLNDERPNAFAELRPIATHERLFDEQLESIEDGIDESIGGFEAGIFRDVDQISSRSFSASADSR